MRNKVHCLIQSPVTMREKNHCRKLIFLDGLLLNKGENLKETYVYFAKPDFYRIIRNVGGQWNDSKERPLVCLIKFPKQDIYWAVPMGDWNHRTKDAQDRIEKYMSLPESDIQSCFYHTIRTDKKSILFISDVVPITDKYIDRFYINSFSGKPCVVKNKSAINEVVKKVKRILTYENARPNYFRQHITDIKNYLLKELEEDKLLTEHD